MNRTEKAYIGHTLNIDNGLIASVDYAEKIDANFYQIFLSSPQQYSGPRQSLQNLNRLKQKLDEKNIKIVVHANFMLNFCNDPSSSICVNAIKNLVNDLKESVIIGAIGVIVHMGKKLTMDRETALNNYVKGIKLALQLSPPNSTLIFETGAGVGTEICTPLHELGNLRKMFTEEEQKRIKFCIDTCHVFSAGYNIGHEKYVEILDKYIDLWLGWEHVICIHLNDSKKPLKSKKDNHADIGKGLIKTDGLKRFVQICVDKSIPIVLETPCEEGFNDADQIKLIRSWIN